MRLTDPCIALTPSDRRTARIIAYAALSIIVIVVLGVISALQSKVVVYETLDPVPSPTLTVQLYLNKEPFPIGVDPERKLITEDPSVDTFLDEHIVSNAAPRHSRTTWFNRAVGVLAQLGWYQNLASPQTRILVIESGERKEQIAANFGAILKWDDAEKSRFLTDIEERPPVLSEGKFFPSRYIVQKDATPETVASLVAFKFNEEVDARYTPEMAAQVPLKDALIIASLLEREAYDFTDMRHISGIIWNRLFADMNLQLDASLQYAKGSKDTKTWWPKVVPNDKYIASVYNTYEHGGLPPAPIANPSLDAIIAALNPRDTDCMFYFHDKNAGFHCAKTYEEHVALLKKHYGQGK